MYPFFPKEMLVSSVAMFEIMFDKGFLDFEVPAGQEEGFKARGVSELMKQAWQ